MLPGRPCLLENLVRFVGDDVCARDVDAESARPQIVVDAAGFVGRNENAGGNDHRIQAAIGKHHVIEHARDALAISDIAPETDGRTAVAYPCARHADAFAVLVDDLLRRFLRRSFVQIDADDMRAFLHEPVRGRLCRFPRPRR